MGGKVRRSQSLLAIITLCLLTGAAQADMASRLTKLLERDTFGPDGQLVLHIRARFEGCLLRITREKKAGACANGASFGKTEVLLDIRVLKTSQAKARISDFGGTPVGSLEYRYWWLYDRGLRRASLTASDILDKANEIFPTDVPARLRYLKQHYADHIAPELYARSKSTTTYCSGLELESPLSSSLFLFYMAPENMEGFRTLLPDYAVQCHVGASG